MCDRSDHDDVWAVNSSDGTWRDSRSQRVRWHGLVAEKVTQQIDRDSAVRDHRVPLVPVHVPTGGSRSRQRIARQQRLCPAPVCTAVGQPGDDQGYRRSSSR